MRGRFKLFFLFSGFLIISLTTFNSVVKEHFVFDLLLSYLSYPVLLLNHKFKDCLQRQKWFLNDRDLGLQNIELKNLVSDLLSQNVALIAQSRYWQEHKEIIEFHQRYNFEKSVLAQVFFKKINTQEHYMLFDKGSLNAVQLGMVAIYKNNILGKVVAVYPHYCQVDLLTSKNCKIAVYDAHTKAVGICCGQNDANSISLSYVSHLQKIACDDLLISSGDGEIFPQGFGVGKISKISNDGMYYQANANLLFDLAQINSCYLINANKS